MKFLVHVRVTRKRRCREGFLVVFNGQRIRFSRRADAIGAVRSLLAVQRFQVVTVRDYAKRVKVKTP